MLCVNLYTSFVFRNGTSFLQPGVILSTGGIIFSILNQAVGKTIVNTLSDCKIVLDAVQLHPNAHDIDFAMRGLFISSATVNAALVLLDVIVNQAEPLSNS